MADAPVSFLPLLETTGARVGVCGAFVEVVHDQGKEEGE